MGSIDGKQTTTIRSPQTVAVSPKEHGGHPASKTTVEAANDLRVFKHPKGAQVRKASVPLSPAQQLFNKCSVEERKKLVPESLITLLWGTNNDMGWHHLGWHLMARSDREDLIAQLNRDPDFVAFDQQFAKANNGVGWIKGLKKLHPKDEGSDGNGLDFGAMHRGMITVFKDPATYTSRGLAVPQGLDKLFEGWTTVPEDVLAKISSPTRRAEIGKTVQLLLDIDKGDNFKKFKSLDDVCNFMQTQLGAKLAEVGISGTHNILHVAMASDSSPINVGDPMLNLFNRDFWGLHGLIDSTITRYIDARTDDFKARKAAIKKLKAPAAEKKKLTAELNAEIKQFRKELKKFTTAQKKQTDHMENALPPVRSLSRGLAKGAPHAHGAPPAIEMPLSLKAISQRMFEHAEQ